MQMVDQNYVYLDIGELILVHLSVRSKFSCSDNNLPVDVKKAVFVDQEDGLIPGVQETILVDEDDDLIADVRRYDALLVDVLEED